MFISLSYYASAHSQEDAVEDFTPIGEIEELRQQVRDLVADRIEANDDLEAATALLRELPKAGIADRAYARQLAVYLEKRISDARSVLGDCADRLKEIREDLDDARHDFTASQEQEASDFTQAARDLGEALNDADDALTR
jgi:DNA repair exonuclease SbcCD ATPase subunit